MAARRTMAAPPEVTPQLAEFLRRLAETEQRATGPNRRPAFRLTRIVIAAALDNNISMHQIAECLDTSVGAIRGRTSRGEAELTPKMVKQLTGLTPGQIEKHAGTELEVTPDGNYLATNVVKLLLAS